MSAYSEEIVLNQYLSQKEVANDDYFTVRVEPNTELYLASIRAIYTRKPNQQKLISMSKINQGIDIFIPKKKDGKSIEKLYFSIDQINFDGISQNIVGGVSMWAEHLPGKLIYQRKDISHVVRYKLDHIGFHGSHPFIYCEDQTKRIRKHVEVNVNGLTTIEFAKGNICKM